MVFHGLCQPDRFVHNLVRYMYDLIVLDLGCTVYSRHCIPEVSSQKKIKLWCLIQPIIISRQIKSPDKIRRVSCDVYFVAVSSSFREASHSPHWSRRHSFEIRCY